MDVHDDDARRAGDEPELTPAELRAADALERALAAGARGGRISAGDADAEAHILAALGRRAAADLRAGDGGPEAEVLAQRILAHLARERVPARAAGRRAAAAAPTPRLLRLVRASPLMRLVAASLLAHLLALPVLAWYTFKAPERPILRVRIEPSIDEPPFATPPPPPNGGPVAPWDAWQQARVERFRLARLADRGLPAPSAAVEAHAERHVWSAALVARIEVWRAGDAERARVALPPLDAPAPPPASPDEHALAQALLLDARLDAALRADDTAELERLGEAVAALPPGTRLAARLAQRARALGLVSGESPPPPRPDHDPLTTLRADLAADLAALNLDLGPWADWSGWPTR